MTNHPAPDRFHATHPRPGTLIPQAAETEAAHFVHELAAAAGNEAAVFAVLRNHARDHGLEALRTDLARLAVITFARWVTPHTPGQAAPVVLPRESA